jgi:hypothetical protein
MTSDREKSSVRSSLAGAIGFGLALAALALLEATHRKADPSIAGDNVRVLKVMLSVALAATMTVVSVICAIFPISKGNLRPLIWLLAVAAGWVAFGVFYDIRSLAK